jgi:hypothetical protein
VPQPAAEAAPDSSNEQVRAAEDTVDVATPSPAVTVTDVPADATVDLNAPQPAVSNESVRSDATSDVTKPVAGTETNTQGDIPVDVEAPPVPHQEPAYQVEFTSAKDAEPRLYAALRLARQRIAAGIVPAQEDVVLAAAIAKSALSNEAIAAEIGTLTAVAAAKRPAPARQAPARPAPVRATAARAVPSLAGGAAPAASAPETVNW